MDHFRNSPGLVVPGNRYFLHVRRLYPHFVGFSSRNACVQPDQRPTDRSVGAGQLMRGSARSTEENYEHEEGS